MSKKLIEDVDLPEEKRIKANEALKLLKQHGCKSNELDIIASLLKCEFVYDCSGFSGVTTFIIPNKSKEGYCIKIANKEGELYEVYILSKFFAKYRLTSSVIHYVSNGKDYLITEQIKSPMALIKYDNFETLAEFMGNTLRKFHDVKWNLDDMTSEEKNFLFSRTDNIYEKALSHDVGLSFIAKYQNDTDYTSMKEFITNNRTRYKENEVIMHGDYNPRNVFCINRECMKMVDFSDSGFGDRHYDIYWTMWTISLYSGIQGDRKLEKECEKIFLDSYGRGMIDEFRLSLCSKLSCMYWQEHNHINSLIK